MLKGTRRQSAIARAAGIGGSQQVLGALLGYHIAGNRDIQPGLPRSTASAVATKRSVQGHHDSIARGTEKYTGTWVGKAQTMKSFSPRESTTCTQATDSHRSPTGLHHTSTLP